MDEDAREVITKTLEITIAMVTAMSKNDELWMAMAKMTRKFYDALKEQGFSSEQAMLIAAHRSPGE